MSQSDIRLTSHEVIKMQNSPPTQAQILNWMSVFLVEKLNQATQNEDWARVLAILSAIKATLQCLQDIKNEKPEG